MLNCQTRALDDKDPDHYRLPYDSPEIPHSWSLNAVKRLRNDHEGQ